MSDDDRARREKLARRFTEALPFSKALDMRIDSFGVAVAGMSMPYSGFIVGDPGTGIVHGGAVSALLDTCGGLAVFLHPEGTAPTATLDLRIDYMRPAKPGHRIHAWAEVYNTTRTVAFVRGIAYDTARDQPVAMLTGAFTFAKKAL
ncbi:MAG: PaaI family thioesterase [Rhodobacteraceae bacterium]|nr:PaaI family thioesterase [Paracoccaceae bacterium]